MYKRIDPLRQLQQQFFNFIGSSDAGAQAVKKTSVNVSVPPFEPVAKKFLEEI